MRTFLYTVLDKVAEEFGPTFEARSDAVAVRQFRYLLAQSSSPIVEFALYKLGSVVREASTISLDLLDPMVHVALSAQDIQEVERLVARADARSAHSGGKS